MVWKLGTLIVAVVLTLGSASAQAPPLADILARAGAYVVEFQRRLSGVVAEEDYVQDVRYPLDTGTRIRSRGITHRELKSDLLMVKPVGGDRWMQFRDTYDVDGKPVRDRNERLMQLFVAPSASSASQADRILEESSRYNIGNLQRTVNVPVLALFVLAPEHQPRFSFKQTDHREPALGRPAVTLSDDLCVIEFQEVQKLTMIRTTNGRDMPSHGRFWVEPATGRVIASELIAEDVTIRGTVAVDYRLEAAIGLLVPALMRERYDIRRDGSRVDGEAFYSHFRQFQVKVDEKLAPIKER